MIDFFWGDEDKDTRASTPVAQTDHSQAPVTDSEMREHDFGADLRLLFNQII